MTIVTEIGETVVMIFFDIRNNTKVARQHLYGINFITTGQNMRISFPQSVLRFDRKSATINLQTLVPCVRFQGDEVLETITKLLTDLP